MTQAQEGLQVLLDMAEDYRKKNNMNSVTISASLTTWVPVVL